jgi:hypothetical protein
MSSPLSALPMANRTIAYSFLLVGVTILASGTFTMLPLLANQFSAFATFPGEDGKIAFSSDRDGNTEIYVMNAQDGSNQTRLTDNAAASDALPDWMYSTRWSHRTSEPKREKRDRTIRIRTFNYDRLAKLGDLSEDFDDAINKVLDFYESQYHQQKDKATAQKKWWRQIIVGIQIQTLSLS